MTGEFIIAVHALTFLHHKNAIVSSSVLADNVCTLPPRIRKVMNKLKKAGLVENINGPNGGYKLTKSAYDITLKDCLDALMEKPIFINWFSGDEEKECAISSGISGVVDEISSGLNSLCMEELKKWNIGLVEELIIKRKEEKVRKNEKI